MTEKKDGANPVRSNDLLSAVGEFIQYTAFDLIQGDPHQWSKRPCSTCKTISTLIKRSFGCVLYAKQKRQIM